MAQLWFQVSFVSISPGLYRNRLCDRWRAGLFRSANRLAQPTDTVDGSAEGDAYAGGKRGRPGLSTWMFFPFLGKRSGFPGALQDTFLLILAAVVASIITAVLLFPTLPMLLVGPVAGFMMVMTPSLQTLVFLSVFLTVLTLGRLKPRP